MKEQVQIHFEFFPETWDAGVSDQVFQHLIGPDRLFPASRMGYEGSQDLSDDVAEARATIVDRYEAMSTGNHIQLFADKQRPEFWFNLTRVEWNEKSLFGSTLFWPKKLRILVPLEHWRTRDWMPDLISVAKITQAPLISLDYAHQGKTKSVFYETRDEMKRVLQSTVHANAEMGPWRGLGRIGWRRVFGRHIVEMIGSERLSALSSGAAIDYGEGYWSVSSAPDPADWLAPEVEAREKAIIRDLGAGHFADIENNRLASIVPKYPARLIPDDVKLFERYGKRLKPI